MCTERIPAQMLLGALEPTPGSEATASPGMTEQKVLACGGRQLVLYRGERSGCENEGPEKKDVDILYVRQVAPGAAKHLLAEGFSS